MTAWIASLDPRIVQGIFALLTVMTGSGTALYIALKVYPRQKDLDRRNEMKRERRVVYGAFLRELIEIHCALNRDGFAKDNDASLASTIESLSRTVESVKKAREHYSNLYASLQVLALSSSPAVFLAASECFSMLGAVLQEMKLIPMQRQSDDEGDIVALRPNEVWMNAVAANSTGSRSLDEAVAHVWQVMRGEEFADNQP